MKQIFFLILSAMFFFEYTSCQTEKSHQAEFEYFEYTVMDSRFDREIDLSNEYLNSILSGFYPDPSICRKGKDYFLVCSSGIAQELIHFASYFKLNTYLANMGKMTTFVDQYKFV